MLETRVRSLAGYSPWGRKRVGHNLATKQQTFFYTFLQTWGEGDDRGWDGWMASLTQWTWVWVNSGSWWWTGNLGVLRFMGSKRVGHDWATTELKKGLVALLSQRWSIFKLQKKQSKWSFKMVPMCTHLHSGQECISPNPLQHNIVSIFVIFPLDFRI